MRRVVLMVVHVRLGQLSCWVPLPQGHELMFAQAVRTALASSLYELLVAAVAPPSAAKLPRIAAISLAAGRHFSS
jgi:hypothetical protein